MVQIGSLTSTSANTRINQRHAAVIVKAEVKAKRDTQSVMENMGNEKSGGETRKPRLEKTEGLRATARLTLKN